MSKVRDHGAKESRALLSIAFVLHVAKEFSLGWPLKIDHRTFTTHKVIEVGGLLCIGDQVRVEAVNKNGDLAVIALVELFSNRPGPRVSAVLCSIASYLPGVGILEWILKVHFSQLEAGFFLIQFGGGLEINFLARKSFSNRYIGNGKVRRRGFASLIAERVNSPR